jgi:hypothetical protein
MDNPSRARGIGIRNRRDGNSMNVRICGDLRGENVLYGRCSRVQVRITGEILDGQNRQAINTLGRLPRASGAEDNKSRQA